MMNRRLKARIIEVYGSQFLFALTVGEHESVTSRIIRGHKPLSPEKRKVWAQALDVAENDPMLRGASNG